MEKIVGSHVLFGMLMGATVGYINGKREQRRDKDLYIMPMYITGMTCFGAIGGYIVFPIYVFAPVVYNDIKAYREEVRELSKRQERID